MAPITRRRLLASAGAGGAGLALGGAGGFLVGHETAEASADGTGSVPFYGEHQAGIDTPTQDRLHFAAFDLVAGSSRSDLRELMREWSAAAAEYEGAPLGAAKESDPLDLEAGLPARARAVMWAKPCSADGWSIDHRFRWSTVHPAVIRLNLSGFVRVP